MIRAMIVDDEIMSRSLLASLVAWEEMGFELVGEAADGREALLLCERDCPDILFIDVSMPHMDGIELMQALSQRGLTPHVVVISSYDNYQFLRETFRMGAVDYLLKDDLTKERFSELLTELRREFKDRPGAPSRPREQEDWMEDYERVGFTGDEPVSLYLCGIPFFKLTMEPLDQETRRFFMQSVVGLITQLLDFDGRQLIKWLKPGVLVLMTPRTEGDRLAGRIRECMMNYLDRTMEIVRMDTTPERFDAKLMEALHALYQSAQVQWRPCLHQIEEGLARQAAQEVMGQYATLRDRVLAAKPSLCAMEEIVEEAARVLAERGVPVELDQLNHVSTEAEICDWLGEGLRAYLSDERRLSDHVRGALQYIREKYAQPIKLSDVARHVGVVPSYLSSSFHSEMGMTFIDYLNRHRIGEAQKLLSARNCPVKDVFHQVGFKNYNYFFTVYRQVTGESPLKRMRSIEEGE